MRKRTLLILVVIGLLLAIMLGNSFANEKTAEVGAVDDYDTSYYVESGNNVFIKIAKGTNQCCYYVVDVIFGGIISAFSSIVDN